MKVVQLVKTLTTGGAELHLLTLCRELVRRDVEVVVACMVDDHAWGTRSLDADFRAAGCRLVRLPWRLGSVVGAAAALRRFLGAETPHLLHTHLPRADVVGAWAHDRRRKTPLISSVHDVYSKAQWRGKWLLPLVRRSWRQCDAVIAISHAVKSWLTRDMGVASEKVRVIHYGIEVERFEGCGNRGGVTGSNGHHVIGAIGRLEPRKGHECLIRALPAIRKQVGPVELHIAGNDPWKYGRTLRELAATLGVADEVKFLGFTADIARFLQGVDVFAFASRSEGFGQVVIEAMASRAPLVASRIEPISEIVTEGESGLLASPDNPAEFAAAIGRLLLSREEALRMGARARQRAQEHFSAARMLVETLELYRQVQRAA
jgi:glycosyltransferase involved in cell wall biosynthesis